MDNNIYKSKVYQHLITAFMYKLQNKTHSQSQISELLDYIFDEKRISTLEDAQLQCFYIISSVSYTLLFSTNHAEEISKVSYEYFLKAPKTKSFDDAKMLLNNYINIIDNIRFNDLNHISLSEKIDIVIMEMAESPINVAIIAKKLDLNPAYIGQIYYNEKGISIKAAINNYKMRIAKKRVLCETASLNTIAFELGFDNYMSFYRVFTQTFGASPMMVRKTQKGDNFIDVSKFIE